MRQAPPIRRDEWLQALADVCRPLEDDQDAMTTAEFAELYQCSRATATRRLMQLQQEGRVRATRKAKPDCQGRSLRQPAWALVQPLRESPSPVRKKALRRG